MSTDLIAALRTRAADPGIRTDQFPGDLGPRMTAAELQQSREKLGFAPHPLLVDVFRHVGNGGFGPGYGLTGLVGGTGDDRRQTAVDLYVCFARPDSAAPAWAWPTALLPIAHWGCAMYTCVDCSDEVGRLVHWEPNVLGPDEATADGLFPMAMALPVWLETWAHGGDLWPEAERAMGARA